MIAEITVPFMKPYERGAIMCDLKHLETIIRRTEDELLKAKTLEEQFRIQKRLYALRIELRNKNGIK